MRMVYLDEAGISNPQQEPFLVVSAIVVHADNDLIAVERHLDKVVRRHIPQEHWNTFVFHATHLFNWGGNVFTKNHPDWPLQKRLEIADELAAIPKKFKLPVAFGFVERALFPQSFELPPDTSNHDKTIAAHTCAFVTCATMVDMWMRQQAPTEVCMLIAEDNSSARSAIRDMQQYHQNKNAFDLIDDPRVRQFYPLRKVKEDPLFQAKRPSSVLQLADFCAYVVKRFLMQDRRYDRFVEPLWERVVTFEERNPLGARPSGKPAQTLPPSRPSQARARSR